MNKFVEKKQKNNQFCIDRFPSEKEVVSLLSKTLDMSASDVEVFDTGKIDIKDRKPKNENLKVWVDISEMKEGFVCFLDINSVSRGKEGLSITYQDLALKIAAEFNCRVIFFDPREDSLYDYLAYPNGKITKIILNVIEGEDDDYYDIGRILD